MNPRRLLAAPSTARRGRTRRVLWPLLLPPLVLGAAGLFGCKDATESHGHGDHSGAAGGAHDHAAPGAEDTREPLAITLWTEKTELFVEFPPLVVGLPSKFAAHITRLSDYAPNRVGSMVLTLRGPVEQHVKADAPKRPGIYGPELVPTQPGEYRMTIQVSGPEVTDTLEVGTVTVYPDLKSLPPAEAAGGPEPVTFLKEQAWRIPFQTALAQAGELPITVRAFGQLEAPPSQSARVSAPVSGLLVPAGSEGFPLAGQPVQRQQVLARLLPAPADGQDLASLEREQRQAQLRLETARATVERLTRLVTEQAAPQRELEEARTQAGVLEAELRAATARLGSLADSASGAGISLTAPLTGRLTAVRVDGQQRVSAGQTLFELAEASSLRLRADVPETELSRLNGVQDAFLNLPGQPLPLRISTLGGRLLSVGSVVEPQTRSVAVYFELPNPEGRLFPGTAVQLELLSRPAAAPALERLGQSAAGPSGQTGVILPTLAVVDDNGQPIVYVQLEGEAFERREVTLGGRSGDQVAIETGVRPGERVVTRGAYEIRLASLSGSGFGEGHSH